MNLTLRCQERVDSAHYACVWKMAEVCCFCAGAEVARDPELLQKLKVVLPQAMCDTCCPLKKSSYASAAAKEEMTASSIVQLDVVSPEKLIVWLTCQRSYPTSHSLQPVQILE